MNSRRKFIKHGLLASFALILLDSFWFEKFVVKWNEFDISNQENNADKITLIQISDLHLKSVGFHHKSIAEKVNTIKPDFILLTGDVIDERDNLDILEEFLNLLDKDIQKIAITGNWEYWGKINLDELKTLYSKNNCEFLINESKQFKIRNRTISFVGIDDFIGGNADFPKAIESLIPSDSCVVLTHCPQHRDVIMNEKGNCKIDLVLSGHTHGGQINLLGLVPFKPQGSGKYLSGWYNDSEPKLFVSKGIGTSIIPVRFGARAEIEVFKI